MIDAAPSRASSGPGCPGPCRQGCASLRGFTSRQPAPLSCDCHNRQNAMGGATASAEASKSEGGSDTHQLLFVALMGFAKGSTHPTYFQVFCGDYGEPRRNLESMA